MNKNLSSLVVAASCLLITSAAFALATPTTKITSVVQSSAAEGGDGNTRIELANATCALPDGTNSSFILEGKDAKHASLLSLTLAAYLSGRSLVLGYDPANCYVTSIRLQP